MKPHLLPEDIENFLYGKIPLTKAMEMRVEYYEDDKLVITAPLSVNHNHLGTAFGGSLAAIATLAGYALLWLELGDKEAHIVIRSSKVSYDRPVRGEIRAICLRPSEATLARFRKNYERSGKGRIKLGVTIEEEGNVCVDFEGIYVAIR
ncbi:YiiD C-terminal domain-containing protein [Haloferula sp. BvORR071]|uniref:YiiD C-terminal domain-containing protein n=1 Tax=Haloferula sp. BvORR071 TaxID=1396141 RepID=UPI00054DA099|nr:YiiD C-terminal domain-containing protein [Haloferula sp. BvORR071]